MGDTMATLTVNFPLQLESVKFSNGNTAKRAQGYNTITFTSSVTISSVALTSGYLSWSGTLYWGKTSGAKTWKFATVSNGSVTILSHEQIDCTGNRTIYITAEAGGTTYASMLINVPSTLDSVTVHASNSYYPKTFEPTGTYQSVGNLPSSGSLWIGTADIIPRTGYGAPYTYSVTNSSGTILESGTIGSKTYITITQNARISITASAATYNVKLVVGTGISTIRYNKNDVSSTAKTISTDETENVGAGGYLRIVSITYDDDYTYPVSAVPSSGSTFVVIDATGGEADTKINAPSSAGTRTVTLNASKDEKTIHIKLGSGVSAANVLVDGAQKAYIQDAVYHDITVLPSSTVTINAINKKAGYGLPYLLTFYASGTSTTPIRTVEYNTETITQSKLTAAQTWLELDATKQKMPIDLFYWDSASTDASLIKAGQPVSNLTATRWNKLLAKIKELAEAEGGSYSYSGVSSGSTIYAATFNAVRTAISNRTGYGTLPAAQSKGNNVKAALFEGSGSLKSALNAAINHYNNS